MYAYQTMEEGSYFVYPEMAEMDLYVLLPIAGHALKKIFKPPHILQRRIIPPQMPVPSLRTTEMEIPFELLIVMEDNCFFLSWFFSLTNSVP
ncbi:hypothetical protein GCM10020331_102580 [Ectobacillus funiculus]